MTVRRSLFVLVLLLLPTGPAQSGPALTIDLVQHAFEYGPEDWKEDLASIEDQETLITQMAGWNASLGLRLEADLQITPRDGTAGEMWRYEASLTDGVTESAGTVEVLETGQIRALFDVDGQRALPGLASVPPLTPGVWTLRVEAYSGAGTGGSFVGSGQIQVSSQGVTPVSVARAEKDPLPGLALPEHLLPHIEEVGPGPNVWMPLTSQAPGSFDVTMQADRPGQELHWVGYVAVALAPDLDPGAGTPIGPYVPGTVDPALQWVRTDFGTSTAGVDGVSTIRIGIRNVTAELLIVAAYDALEGGVGVVALGVAEERARIIGLQAPDPGTEGNLVVHVESGDVAASGLSPGMLFALSQGTPGNTGQDVSGSALASAPVLRDAETSWRADLDTRAIRASGVGAYTLAAFMVQDNRYGGHAGLVRGVTADLRFPLLGEGHEADVEAVLTNVGGDGRAGVDPALAFTTQARLTLDGTPVETRDAAVPEGGSIILEYPVTPESAGDAEFVLTVDSGDVRHEVRRVETVLDEDAFEKAGQKWYSPERLTPGPAVPLVLAVLAFLVGRKR